MDIGEIKEIGDRKVRVPQQRPAEPVAPARSPPREKEKA